MNGKQAKRARRHARQEAQGTPNATGYRARWITANPHRHAMGMHVADKTVPIVMLQPCLRLFERGAKRMLKDLLKRSKPDARAATQLEGIFGMARPGYWNKLIRS